MSLAALDILERIGRQLDADIYPEIFDGGFVMPRETIVPEHRGEVTQDERPAERGSETGSREGSTGGQGPTGETPPLIGAGIPSRFQSELNAVFEAYPKTQVWNQPDGLMLLTKSVVLYGQQQSALFLVVIPYDENRLVKGWGFWEVAKVGIEWIGPRHTNAPDGSICAFEAGDRTWQRSDSILELLDLYTLWALRHLHVRVFGRWPGRHSAQGAYERIFELKPDEYCGCGKGNKRYADCCQQDDGRRSRLSMAVSYMLRFSDRLRVPPTAVTGFILNPVKPPPIGVLFGVRGDTPVGCSSSGTISRLA